MTKLQDDDYLIIKGWATTHMFMALGAGVAVGMALGALLF